MSSYEIRTVGDPVLRTVTAEVTDIDASLVKVTKNMFTSMYDAAGIGLAAPQVGIQKRFFVYDHGENSGVILNPQIVESDGEWVFEEACLSIPGLSWEIIRPKTIHLVGIDLDGNEVSIEADELEARLFQHEIDHLNGVLLLDLLDDDNRRQALKKLRDLDLRRTSNPGSDSGELRLP
ncbi:MAG: peptide deformylase [Actinomycetota bacterium]|jgi:peptide deformylase|nr:peptide deformylase [Acidimicrobiaceae bacterium]MBD35363.1 peptide deformylase [Actinomycetota bacterium]CAI8304560.1 MAG: Peptide deformylase [Acidimicrobiales bacterium AG-410-I20]MBO30215.1 peptide deformylase [Acidimicrobiaceae bacterium]MEC9034425.1 peptide deformylase [Actinomycetota bacterium]|tara:strand:+ start:1831 stop:2364 length:534 start_codon:yes stop_codon:yes gene_type:complete